MRKSILIESNKTQRQARGTTRATGQGEREAGKSGQGPFVGKTVR